MVFEVKVSPAVLATVHHTRRRGSVTFGPEPIYLAKLPPQIGADPHLRVKALRHLPEGAHFTQAGAEPSPPPATLKPERVQPATPVTGAVTSIKGVGPGTAKALAKAGIKTLAHLRALDLAAVEKLPVTPGAIEAIRAWRQDQIATEVGETAGRLAEALGAPTE